MALEFEYSGKDVFEMTLCSAWGFGHFSGGSITGLRF